MIKISALNEESDEDSDSEEETTREALEQIALQQYAKALELQRSGNVKDAMQLLKDLLETELLYDVKKPAPGEKATEPLFNLKYLCHKNVAAMLAAAGDAEAAIESYNAAADLDDTDVTLWHRLGQLYLQVQCYDMALHAFQCGVDRNPKHWPCLDKIVTLLMGLGYYGDCITTIYDTLLLDPGYLRGLVYRKHIYTNFPYIRDFLEHLNPKFKWDEKEDDFIDEKKAEYLLKEAEAIHTVFQEQRRADEAKNKMSLPDLKLQKPINTFTWLSVGESLVHMHKYMTDNALSHACFLELVFEKEIEQEQMDVCEEQKQTESNESKLDEISPDTNNDQIMDKNGDNGSSDNENNEADREKVAAMEADRVDSDVEIVQTNDPETQAQSATESKESKKAAVRRRGSDLSFLQQWEWCNKRKSGRKKTVLVNENNIYDNLRKMVPTCLVPEIVEKGDNQNRESSPDVTDLDKLFEDKDPKTDNSIIEAYFGEESEQKDVKAFISKYTENKRDIIEMLKEFLKILCKRWDVVWPEYLPKVFMDANKCYNNHIDVPTCTDENREELQHYVTVNIAAEEFSLNEKLIATSDEKPTHCLSIAETIGLVLSMKPHFFGGECLQLLLRFLWVKLHAHLVNRNDEFALDCVYQLLHEFEAMGEHHDTYKLNLPNFSFKAIINEVEIMAYLKFLERNKRLSTVLELYDLGRYEEVLSIVIDSFEHCKEISRTQEEEMSLDFSLQLCLILDAYWALDKVEECLKWSFICLHEALKHFFHFTSGCQDYEKWSRTVVKILSSMEHILSTEGLHSLEYVPRKDLSQGLEDLIRIIGHQVETNATEMPFDTVIPWIVMHYIIQREDDQGRGTTQHDKETAACDEVPNPLMVLFIGHEQLGSRSWCSKNEGKLLYFIMDTVVPRLRSPFLAKSLEQVQQYMEQCVFCLFGHPAKKNKLKYLEDHNVTAATLDWPRAQQIYEIFRPTSLPELQGKVTALTVDTEPLYHRILGLLPPECDLQKYIPDVEKFLRGKESKLPTVPPLIPYKMKDIFFLLGDYYFKKEDYRMSIKYNMMDVAINNQRFESMAEITLAKAVSLERCLNSCNNINNEKDFLKPAKTIIRYFNHALALQSNWDIWVEYGVFAYYVHSFCSRLLKQASESLSMEDFESLEKQKDEMLDTSQKCFGTVAQELKHITDPEKVHEGMWLAYYLLGKVAEKRNKPPPVYIDYYLKSVKSLHEAEAIYPSKINYSSPQHYAIEVLELHYRIHASILKYIEQHENKPIPASVGKVFLACIEEWKSGPFSRKFKKIVSNETENAEPKTDPKPEEINPQAANILKRSISDAGEEESPDAKRMKLETAAAKVRRSSSYDMESIAAKESHKSSDKLAEMYVPTGKESRQAEKKDQNPSEEILETNTAIQPNGNLEQLKENPSKVAEISGRIPEAVVNLAAFAPSTADISSKQPEICYKIPEAPIVNTELPSTVIEVTAKTPEILAMSAKITPTSPEMIAATPAETSKDLEGPSKNPEAAMNIPELSAKAPDDIAKTSDIPDKSTKNIEKTDKMDVDKEGDSSSSSSSSSDSSSSDSSSNSSSDSNSSKSSNESRPLANEEIININTSCLTALEDCVSRFPLHYKALYRIAHYHFYYKKGKDIERCRDVLLSNFTSKLGTKMTGLFGERKTTNFFNNIWRIPVNEVDRPGGFVNHMNRCVLLTMEILKEIDDHKTLLDLSLQLQKIPDQDKKYLRDSDREELAQQALSLCVQSLKGQLLKFGQQADLKTNEIEKKAFNSLMLDIYRAYQRAQKQPSAKLFINLLIDGYKFVTSLPINDNMNFLDLSMKYCQSLKQQATMAAIEKSQNVQKKQQTKSVETAKASVAPSASLLKPPAPQSLQEQVKTSTSSAHPKMSSQEMAAAFQNYLPMLNDPVMSQQTAAALSLSYLSNLSALAGYSALQSTLQSSLQSSLQNSFQAEFYRQFLGQSISSYNLPPPPKKQKRGPKPGVSKSTSHTTPVTSLGSKSVSNGSTSVSASSKPVSIGSTPVSAMVSKSVSVGSTSIHPIGSKSTSFVPTSTYNLPSSYPSKPSSTTVTALGSKSHSHGSSAPKIANYGSSVTALSALAKQTNSSKTYTSHSSHIPRAAPTSVSKSTSATLVPTMGTVLSSLPASMTAGLIPSHLQSSSNLKTSHVSPAHMTTSKTISADKTNPPQPHQQIPGKTLQEKLAERQKNLPVSKLHDMNTLSRLPSSLTITKSSQSKPSLGQGKKSGSRKAFAYVEVPPKQISSDEVIVLDDDDD